MALALENTASRKILMKGEKFARGSTCSAIQFFELFSIAVDIVFSTPRSSVLPVFTFTFPLKNHQNSLIFAIFSGNFFSVSPLHVHRFEKR
jgi:hypothetical protein